MLENIEVLPVNLRWFTSFKKRGRQTLCLSYFHKVACFSEDSALVERSRGCPTGAFYPLSVEIQISEDVLFKRQSRL